MDKVATENDPRFKQLIVYCVIRDDHRRLFVYERASGKEYDESRLWGNSSIGIGGHIEIEDVVGKTGVVTILNTATRELDEELKIWGRIESKKITGIVNYDFDDVSLHHAGIVVMVRMKGTVKLANAENVRCGMKTIPEIVRLFGCNKSLEAWSRIIISQYLPSPQFPLNFAFLPPKCAYKFDSETV